MSSYLRPFILTEGMRAALLRLLVERCGSRRELGVSSTASLYANGLVRVRRNSGFVELSELGELVALGLRTKALALQIHRPMRADRSAGGAL